MLLRRVFYRVIARMWDRRIAQLTSFLASGEWCDGLPLPPDTHVAAAPSSQGDHVVSVILNRRESATMIAGLRRADKLATEAVRKRRVLEPPSWFLASFWRRSRQRRIFINIRRPPVVQTAAGYRWCKNTQAVLPDQK
jgi:hypothetical protein